MARKHSGRSGEDRTLSDTPVSFGHLHSFDTEVVKEARAEWPELRLVVRTPMFYQPTATG